MLAIYALMGLQNTAASRSFYVMIPYAILLLPLLFALSGAWYTAIAPIEMKREQYDKSVLRIRLMGILLTVFALLCTAGTAVFLALHGAYFPEIIFLFGALIISVLGYVFYKIGNYAKLCTKVKD